MAANASSSIWNLTSTSLYQAGNAAMTEAPEPGQEVGGVVAASSCAKAAALRLEGSGRPSLATRWRTTLSWMRIESTSALKVAL